ncbi:tRNA lysidine(34) synthetase TilS [Tamlana sp. 2_MG-2023]|uniref:tRNA lysidine(34) synthetase TilS n=1 Tax=unclassified Tamlana TaxID=2614803 RepID=UPI0026E15BC4|nr:MULTISPECIES: tRNA lysidine(34) synthetase TilS [unclassified Tamlana]MDO6758967.1 tRNA lysidine(34) synthetase TilS [Tamlana sp. 2_MG-2023]MDO6789666.1 tRNA lysidine(34) synthetase TilS [Tamlana sp. 1_MG-2023]
MLAILKNHIENRLKFLNESKLLIAISGGIDSVVLTHLCRQLNLNIALAHCNFNLRGDESDADESFVQKLAENLGLEVFVQNFDTEKYSQDHKRSIQMAARELRYNWFEELSQQLGYDYILTAHHADDNLETFLINFTRGTGLEGLTGIPEVNGKFVRPLLPFSSENIEAFAKEHSIQWRDDSSNKSVKYLRNKLRHEVIPILKEINPSLLKSFDNTLHNLQDTAVIVEDAVDGFLNKSIESIDNGIVKFKISEFKQKENPKPYLYEAFKEFGFTEWDDVLHLLDAETGKQIYSNTYRLLKNREHLLLSEMQSETEVEIQISEAEKKVETALGTLIFSEVEEISETHTNCIYVDKALLKFPLTLRKKQEGDVFYPLGMTGKKKLSKYFKDEKLSLLDKENTWLLCSGEDIVWVVNRRADNRFKVTPDTEGILKIEVLEKL